MLGLGTDMYDDFDDVQIFVDGVPFIASELLLGQYGNAYEALLNEGRLQVRAVA